MSGIVELRRQWLVKRTGELKDLLARTEPGDKNRKAVADALALVRGAIRRLDRQEDQRQESDGLR